ncbi:MAG: outer-membrane lipoprotein carrier protein LolA [Hyphomicrobiaceae bacterium]|nr:outer-membrane lipoprotein carrier protein LolA [Hyphomicrobiaceae bacterium]
MARQARKRWRVATGRAAAAGIALALAVTCAAAQDKSGSPNPVGQPTWGKTDVTPSPVVAGITLDARQMEVVQKVNAYFNALENMKGQFLQTTSDNKRMKGRLYMKKPGRVRFDYALPSKQLVISDGQQIAIIDSDIGTDDRVMVDQTPFRVLLRKDVDLIRDARILEVQEADDLIILALQDKSKDASGRIRLFMATKPEIELKEWVTTDAQGLDTRVEVSSIDRKDTVDAGMFKMPIPTIKSNQ